MSKKLNLDEILNVTIRCEKFGGAGMQGFEEALGALTSLKTLTLDFNE